MRSLGIIVVLKCGLREDLRPGAEFGNYGRRKSSFCSTLVNFARLQPIFPKSAPSSEIMRVLVRTLGTLVDDSQVFAQR